MEQIEKERGNASVRLERNGDNLVIKYGENDSVMVQNAYYSYYVDGSKLTTEGINVKLKTKYGTDTMVGYSSSVGYDQNDTFYAGAGNDKVYGYDGNDTWKFVVIIFHNS